MVIQHSNGRFQEVDPGFGVLCEEAEEVAVLAILQDVTLVRSLAVKNLSSLAENAVRSTWDGSTW